MEEKPKEEAKAEKKACGLTYTVLEVEAESYVVVG